LKTYYLTTTQRSFELAKNINAIPFENGFLAGPYALLLKELVHARVNTILLLTESFLEFPDPEAAAKSLELVSKIIGRPIDVKELVEEAELIRIKARDAMKNTMRGLIQMRKDVEHTNTYLYLEHTVIQHVQRRIRRVLQENERTRKEN